MTFFSSDAFLAAARAAYHPNASIAEVDVAGSTYRVLTDDRGRPITTTPFLDVIAPFAPSSASARPTAGWLRPVELSRTSVDDPDAADTADSGGSAVDDGDLERRVGPYVDWSTTDTFDDFMAASRKRSSRAFRQLRKRPAQVEKHLGGEVTFTAVDTSAEHLDQCLAWKSDQYVASGFSDLLAQGGTQLFRHLIDNQAARLSTLTYDGRLLAAHIGALHEGTFYYWLPSYDGELSKFSPGSLLLEQLLRDSFERGDERFDFLEGAEPYKFFYATHIRHIGEVGTPPLQMRARRLAGTATRRLVERFPQIDDTVKKIRARLSR